MQAMTVISPAHPQLTQSQMHPLGGQAYLSLESSDEPFLGGIKYNALPPTKRFRDMEQLSGERQRGSGHHDVWLPQRSWT